MKYDIEAEWYLIKTCNFRCSYCFFSADFLNSKRKIYGTPEQWQEGFNATGKTWLLYLTGGEPSLYPDFVELCDELTQKHYLSINTNLTHHCFNDFVKRINPERICCINASIHFQERQKRGWWKNFIERALELQKAKFKIIPSVVMTPQVVRVFPEISEYLEAQGLFALPKVMRGIYEGKFYPSSYSSKEKKLIGEYINQKITKYEFLLKTVNDLPPMNLSYNRDLLNGAKDYRGFLCSAGSKFVAIYVNGTVLRCGSSEVYGNILFKNLKLLDAPKICDSSYCPSFCEKYSIKGNKYDVPARNIYSKLKAKIYIFYYMLQTDGALSVVNKITSMKTKDFSSFP